MRILVTGGAGFIGSHVCKVLAQAGHEPITYDNLSTGHASAVRWGPLEIGDIRDAERLDDVFRRHRPAAIMHFAAMAYVGESVERPAAYYDVNVRGTLALAMALVNHGVGDIVFSSSCATYGIPDVLPITESTPQRPINPYGFTKLVGERLLQDFGNAYGLRTVALRYFNAAGADPDGELGEDHNPETHAIPLAIRAAIGRDAQFKVFGLDYPTPDGSAVRDYIHVADLADAHLRALDLLSRESFAGVRPFNISTGQPASVLEVLRTVEQITGRTVPRLASPRRQGDPPALFATAEAARSTLGWSPRFSSLPEIVETAYRWLVRSDG